MSIYLIFGLPGAGKTFIGRIFEKEFGYFFYDGDNELTDDMKDAIKNKIPFTNPMRNKFFQKLISKIKELKKNHPKIVVTQTFIKEKYRKWVIDEIPEARFVLVETKTEIRESRLNKRTDYPLDIEYARGMCLNFDPPLIPHKIIINDAEGKESIKDQINSFDN